MVRGEQPGEATEVPDTLPVAKNEQLENFTPVEGPLQMFVANQMFLLMPKPQQHLGELSAGHWFWGAAARAGSQWKSRCLSKVSCLWWHVPSLLALITSKRINHILVEFHQSK